MSRLSVVLALVASVGAMVRPPAGILTPRAWQARGQYTDRPDMPDLDDIAIRAGVRAAPWNAPRWVWTFVWRFGKRAIPWLHRWDECKPTDTNVNLMVCWLKAIGGNSWRSGMDDGQLGYDLLPPWTRRVVAKPVASLYPLLHHQNVLLRSAYLDRQVSDALSSGGSGSGERSAVVVLGAGFDLRSLRLSSSEALSARWVEVDLPHVIEQRRRLLARLAVRRPPLASRIEGITQLSANLSVATEVELTLRDALRPTSDGGVDATDEVGDSADLGRWSLEGGHAIFVIEALMIYLDPSRAAALLHACADEARAAGATRATLCFADRLPNMPKLGSNVDDAGGVLADAGFENDEAAWLPKPGLARHMGVARWTRHETLTASDGVGQKADDR